MTTKGRRKPRKQVKEIFPPPKEEEKWTYDVEDITPEQGDKIKEFIEKKMSVEGMYQEFKGELKEAAIMDYALKHKLAPLHAVLTSDHQLFIDDKALKRQKDKWLIKRRDLDDLILNVLKPFIDGRSQWVVELRMPQNFIGSNGVAMLAACLEKSSTLEVLNLAENMIDRDMTNYKKGEAYATVHEPDITGIKALANALKKNQSLKILELNNNELGDDAVGAIFDGLQSNSTVTRITLDNQKYFMQRDDVSKKRITKDGAKKIADCLKVNKTLKELNLSGNNLKGEGAQFLSTGLEQSGLEVLWLERNFINDVGAKALAKELEKNTIMKILHLKDNKAPLDYDTGYEDELILKDGKNAIEQLLDKNKKISVTIHYRIDVQGDTLDLSEREYKTQDINIVCSALRNNSTIKTIDMLMKREGFKSVPIIASALKMNATLTHLELRSNNIKCKGAKLLGDALKTNGILQRLNVCGNKIECEGAVAIGEGIRNNSVMKELHIADNRIMNKGGISICSGLETNSLTELNLSDNFMEDEAGLVLAKALKTNSTLKELGVLKNNWTDPVAEALGEALKVNKTLKALYIFGNYFENGYDHLRKVKKDNSLDIKLFLIKEWMFEDPE